MCSYIDQNIYTQIFAYPSPHTYKHTHTGTVDKIPLLHANDVELNERSQKKRVQNKNPLNCFDYKLMKARAFAAIISRAHAKYIKKKRNIN